MTKDEWLAEFERAEDGQETRDVSTRLFLAALNGDVTAKELMRELAKAQRRMK